MNNEIQIFSNEEFGEIRTLAINDEPWLVGKDVAEILGYANPNEAISDHVDDEDKLNSKTLSSFSANLGQRGGWLINESGLYSLIMSSKLPAAKKFKRWVTSEVLPSIRKNGGYIAGQESMTPAELMASALLMAQKTLAEREARIADLTVQNQIMQPKAEYFDELCDRETLTGIYETAKELGVAPRKFTADLVKHRYLYRGKKGQLLPCESKNDGLFVLKETFNNQTKWSGTQTLITVKGRELFRMMRLGA
jgi:prophage antirepressor-like protein